MQWMMAGNVAILALFCFYLAHKLYALLGAGRGRKLNKLLFASLYALAAILCVGAFFWKRSADLVPWLSGLCSILSAFYIGMMIYGLLLFGLTDIARLLVRLFRMRGRFRAFLARCYARGLTVFLLSALLTGLAMVNTQIFVVKPYDIAVDGRGSGLDGLNVVMVSDLHLGATMGYRGLARMVDRINALEPDVVCLCGDIFDEATPDSLKEAASAAFSRIESRYGSYFVIGNHDYGHGDEGIAEATLDYFRRASVRVLSDEAVTVEDGFIIAGRTDSTGIFRKEPRQSVSDLLEGKQEELPVILLDHKPGDVEEAARAGVSLQLPGHTHSGQVLPVAFLIDAVFPISYGEGKFEDMYAVVSSGLGAWGFPLRLGSRSEIVQVRLSFQRG